MKKTILTLIIVLTSLCTAFAQGKATANSGTEIPAKVSQWINRELAKAKRKTLMNFKAGEFFAPDTARLIGYIKGYNPQAGFSTGMIYIGNDITREDSPIVVQIHEDGRFECAVLMNYPVNSRVNFNDDWIDFYIQPGQTLAMLLNMDSLQKNIRYRGVTGNINNELFAFQTKLPDIPYEKIQDERKNKMPEEFKSFLDSCLANYSQTYQRLLKTEKISEQSKTILRNNYQIMYASRLLDYEIYVPLANMPLEYYDFLRDIPMNNKELLSTKDFSTFINRLEFCQPLSRYMYMAFFKKTQPEKNFVQYLFEELKIPKTPEDEPYLLLLNSINDTTTTTTTTTTIRLVTELNSQETKEMDKSTSLEERYEKQYEDYKKKYLPTQEDEEIKK